MKGLCFGGNGDCTWIIIILVVLFCCCGGNNDCDHGCGCERKNDCC